jgi:hypothetical protein
LRGNRDRAGQPGCDELIGPKDEELATRDKLGVSGSAVSHIVEELVRDWLVKRKVRK